MLEPYTLLAAVAGRTRTLQLGVLATSVTYRSPALVAKMVTTLDVISQGRAILGIGAGHPRTEGEQRSYGIEFPPITERMDRLAEALQVIRALFRENVASFSGRYYRVSGAHNFPRPVQPGGPSILVAGSGERRLLPLVAQYADQCNLSFPSGDHLGLLPHKLAVLAQHCEAFGREPAEITKTYKALLVVDRSEARAQSIWAGWRNARGMPDVGAQEGVFVGTPDQIVDGVAAFFEAGIDEMIFELPDAFDLDALALANEALAPFVRQQTSRRLPVPVTS
jgi:alkanesulfonate monooxygenase SsuD/methylene tetrahydromethanopterin reductase-like flavin-dependent oxidoreductase (luciferase family)